MINFQSFFMILHTVQTYFIVFCVEHTKIHGPTKLEQKSEIQLLIVTVKLNITFILTSKTVQETKAPLQCN